MPPPAFTEIDYSRTSAMRFSEGDTRLNWTDRPQTNFTGLIRWRIQFSPTLLDEQKNGDLMWTTRYVVR